MNLYQKIISMSLEELAKLLVRPGYYKDFDYVFDGETEYGIDLYVEGFNTSDMKFFYCEDDAIRHQIDLLKSECLQH